VTESLTVRTPSRPYPVVIGPGIVARLGTVLDQAEFPRRRIIVSSPTVWRFHGQALAEAIPNVPVVLIPDGERHKTLQTTARIYDALVRERADRGAGIVAMGGGVLGDVAGFAAATFLRGIAVAHVPTTLLAQVDSAIGGKVGVNHALGKNLIGAFHQPRCVAIDPLVLATLPRREFRAGLYEVVKYGMTSSAALFDRLRAQVKEVFKRQPDILVPIIAESCHIKAEVVERDEQEQGLRRILNFGHTAGHAIEAVTKYRRFRHGEAVAFGMLVAAQVGVNRGMLEEPAREALADLVRRLGPLPPVADLTVASMVEAMRLDKKVVDGRLHFVLSTAIGRAIIVDDVREDELISALRAVGFKS
jgi:3-dehydroquinate synthase